MTHQLTYETPETVRSVVEDQGARHPDATYVLEVRGPRAITYDTLASKARAWRATLSTLGVSSGARVGLVVADPLDFSEAFISLLAAGVWVAPLDPSESLGTGELIALRSETLGLDLIISDRPAPHERHVHWYDMYACPATRDAGSTSSDSTFDASNGGVLLSSSGTTGTPKVIALSIAQLLHAATLVANHNKLTPVERGMNPLPLWHVNAEVVGLLATLVSGASLALDDRFHRTGFWTLVDSLGVTWINAVPAIISRLVALQEDEVAPSRVRFIRSASAPLAPALLRQFEEATDIRVVESYGMTEAASQICVNPLDARKIGSVGRPVGVELRVRSLEDATPTHLEPFVVGNVEIRGRSVITRYEAEGYEDRFDAEGWLRTGDLGYVDDEGFVFLVGRSDDVINRGGEKIFPREIEEAVLGLVGVSACAVVGAPHDVYGQVPVLFVQLEDVDDTTSHDDMLITVKEIHDVLVSSFARARRPVSINVVEHFPSHATGKIQKRFLTGDSVPVLLEHRVS
ncbi:MAG: AMP-binding protein [Acidimicrobiales bacterium]